MHRVNRVASQRGRNLIDLAPPGNAGGGLGMSRAQPTCRVLCTFGLPRDALVDPDLPSTVRPSQASVRGNVAIGPAKSKSKLRMHGLAGFMIKIYTYVVHKPAILHLASSRCIVEQRIEMRAHRLQS